jgi:copper chaperone
VETRYIVVSGMSCEHCAHAVTAQVSKLPGVTEVDVDITGGKVKITAASAPGDAELRAAIEEAGYELVGLQHHDEHVAHGDTHRDLAERGAAGG